MRRREKLEIKTIQQEQCLLKHICNSQEFLIKDAKREGISKQSKNNNYVQEYSKNNLKDDQSWNWLKLSDLNGY